MFYISSLPTQKAKKDSTKFRKNILIVSLRADWPRSGVGGRVTSSGQNELRGEERCDQWSVAGQSYSQLILLILLLRGQ